MIANTPGAWSKRARAAKTSHEAALWSMQGQLARFHAVLSALDPRPHERLLDYGCGTGAFFELVPDDVDYVGYDWSMGMRERARRDHPDAVIVDRWPSSTFDLVCAIGTFNLVHNWTKTLTIRKLVGLWERHQPRVLVASVYAGEDPNCLSYEIEDVLHAIRGAVVEMHRPLANDILAIFRRP